MPIAKYRAVAGKIAPVEAIAKYHIAAFRCNTKGEVTAVKHIAMGWMRVKDYYNLQKAHEFAESPIIAEVIRGGYEFKSAIWRTQISVDVLATGVSIPMGVVLVTVAFTLYAADTVAGNQAEAVLDLASLFLPFGELWLLVRGADLIASYWNKDVVPAIKNVIGGAVWWEKGLTHLGIDPVQVLQITGVLDRFFGWNKFVPPVPSGSYTVVLTARPGPSVKVGDFLSVAIAVVGAKNTENLYVDYDPPTVPPGLTFHRDSWVFDGHVTTAGTYYMSVRVLDSVDPGKNPAFTKLTITVT